MLIDTRITIAYKCSSCGSFKFFNLSLFDLTGKTLNSRLTCRCKGSSIKIIKEACSNISIEIPCIGCGSEHKFAVDRNKLIHNEINIFNCPVTGMKQCFIGRDDIVRKSIDNFEDELDRLIDMFGYDNYFKNTQVMLDSLDKIHDIAEHGNLKCGCGNSDIELLLYPDRIMLKCKKCAASQSIFAGSNKDLKDIMLKQHILLVEDFIQFEAGNKITFLEKAERGNV